MPSLLDIAPPEIGVKQLTVRGVTLDIHGIPAIDWAALYRRFPVLQRIVSGEAFPVLQRIVSGEAVAEGDMSPLHMVQMQCAVIAAGVGRPGDADIERAALANLSRDELLQVMQEVVQLSLPGDALGPLLDAAAGDLLAAAGGRAGKAPDTN